ncbi:MAG: helix-turn-helix transcriptional regulator [Bacteroidetes bacterium]|nr:helix-turn-helix transcriptional regulator [Bacteroidota bacterium]
MGFETKYITPDIKLSEFKGKMYKAEAAFDFHILVWFIAGETTIIQGDSIRTFGAGDIFLIPRNYIATFLNYSKEGQNHQSVTMHLTTEKLKEFYEKHPPVVLPHPPQKVISFGRHPLLESCLVSLKPYFEVHDAFPENIASLKITEAISVLRLVDPAIDGVLANFEEPGKIDLADFMEKHFATNLPMERFGYLTGRSLSTFHRDFKKTFHTTPQKWLTEKRLVLAHYLMKEKKRKPSDVYLEAGFEDLSHFSFAFKKHFGYPPTNVPA